MGTDLARQIQPKGYFGIFADDTRFLSYYACYVDGHTWKRLTSTTTTYYATRIQLTNPGLRLKMARSPRERYRWRLVARCKGEFTEVE